MSNYLDGYSEPYPSYTAFNIDDYRHYLDGLGLTTEQETEVIQAMWSMTVGSARFGWEQDSMSTLYPTLFNDSACEMPFEHATDIETLEDGSVQ